MYEHVSPTHADIAQPPLRHVWLEITGRCNLECTHCYSDSGPDSEMTGKMTLADWKKFMDDASAEGCPQVQIIGGEPLVHPDFAAILKHAAKKFSAVEVYTNATMLTPQRVQFLKEMGASVATSIYADNALVHDAVTQRKGSFSRTVANIKHAIDSGIPVRASVILTPQNATQDITELTAFLKNLGVHHVGVDHLRGIGRGAVNNDQKEHPEQELCGQCFNGSLCATFDGKAHPCIMSRTIDLGDVRGGISALLARKAEAEAEARLPLLAGNSPNCLPRECLPRTCSPNGEQCLPTTCTPRCGPVWKP